uniref:Uncharacterized protein n=1 Tax=Tetradesmus obliquus TaxID=3088 RepID=A0A383VAQ8_TETOB|eukprot:jgi/Sobl393_1/3312/SZX61842.1
MKLYTALFLALLVLATQAEQEQDDTHDQNGYSLKFIGKAPKFQFAPSADNSSWVRVEFGSVFEATDSGDKVAVHSIESLAAVKPVYTTGYETVNNTNVTYVLMKLPFANLTTLEYNGSNCASPVVSADEFAAGYLAIKVQFGFSNDVIFPYGVNNTVVALANSTKFSIEAKGWPFCSMNNTLQIEMETSTAAGNEAKPIHSDQSEDGEQDAPEPVSTNATEGGNATSTPSSPTRKLLKDGKPQEHGSSNGDHDRNSPEPTTGSGAAGHPSGRPSRPPHPRDPRVVDKPRKQVAMLTGKPGKAAMLDFEAYAYDAVDGSQLLNVTTSVMEHGSHLMVTLGFPYFTSIYYDPTVATNVDSTVAGYTANTTAEVVAALKNAGDSLRLGAVSFVAGGLLLALLL